MVAAALAPLDIVCHHTAAAAAFVLMLVRSGAVLVLVLVWIMRCTCFDVG